MTHTSLALLKNQKVPCILHILQDYSVGDLWPHLHQTVQMSDDIEDPPQMQLETGSRIENWKGKETFYLKG